MTDCRLTDEQRQLVEDNMKLVPYVVNRFYNSTVVEVDELISMGYIALCEAAKRYRRMSKTKFSTYACRCILLYLKGEIRKIYASHHIDECEIVSLNQVVPLEHPGYHEDELIDLIIDESVDVQDEVERKATYDNVRAVMHRVMPTYSKIFDDQLTVREYAKMHSRRVSSVNRDIEKELRLARLVLEGRVNIDAVPA